MLLKNVNQKCDQVTSLQVFAKSTSSQVQKLALRKHKKIQKTQFNETGMTEFRQPLQVQSHLEMPGILVQLGHIQCT